MADARRFFVKEPSVTAVKPATQVLTTDEAIAEFRERLRDLPCTTRDVEKFRDAVESFFARFEQARDAEAKAELDAQDALRANAEADRAAAAAQDARGRADAEARAQFERDTTARIEAELRAKYVTPADE